MPLAHTLTRCARLAISADAESLCRRPDLIRRANDPRRTAACSSAAPAVPAWTSFKSGFVAQRNRYHCRAFRTVDEILSTGDPT